MSNTPPTLSELYIKTIVVHTVTYFVVGMIAFVALNYTKRFAEPGLAGWMRQTDDPNLVCCLAKGRNHYVKNRWH